MTGPSLKKPGKINKFLEAYMSAASDAPQPTTAPVKPARKWTPKATPKSIEDTLSTKVPARDIEVANNDAGDEKLEYSAVDDSASHEQVDENQVNQEDLAQHKVEEAGVEQIQEPLTKEQKAAQREANYKQLLENSNAEEEKIGRMLSLMSHASELCATPGTPQTLEEQDNTKVLVAEELRIDPMDCVDEEGETKNGVEFADEVNFDEGSVIAAEEEHDMIIAEDTLDPSFDSPKVQPNESKAGSYEGQGNKLLDTSIDTVSTVDMTLEKEEAPTPDSKNSAGPKRNSRSFSKARERFQKRKNVNKPNSSANGVTSSCNNVDASAVEGNVNARREGGGNVNPFDVDGGEFVEHMCTESNQEGSRISDNSVASSSADDEKRSEADHSNVSDGVHSNKFSFYTADRINSSEEEKKKNATSSDDDSEMVDGMKFSFYSSTPIDNTSLSDDSMTKDVINSSFLADGDKKHASKANSDEMGFYTSTPMNMESFDGSDALAFNGGSSTNTTDNESEVCEVEEGFDGDYVDQILNDDSSYPNNKALGGSSRSFVSFREKKQPGSRKTKASNSSNAMLVKTETVDLVESENMITTTIIDSLHAKAINASNSSPLMKKYQLGRSLDVTARTLAKNKASTNIFTKQEIDSITSGQIAVYLSLEERKSIGTKVLSEKMMRGYSIAVSTEETTNSTVCNTCDMPMLTKSGKLLDSCIICPVLKKKTLKRILNPVHENQSNVELTYDSFHDAALSEARKELLDVSKRKSYYDRSPQHENKVVARVYDESRNAVQHARDVLSNKVAVNDSDNEREGNEKVQPRILFPDDSSVEVVQIDDPYPLETKCVEKTPSSSVQASCANGRPSLPPQCPASVRSKSSQQLTAQSPNAKVVASSTALTIQKQIEDTKGKLLLTATDPKRQILYSDLLNELNNALVAVEQLEDILNQ